MSLLSAMGAPGDQGARSGGLVGSQGRDVGRWGSYLTGLTSCLVFVLHSGLFCIVPQKYVGMLILP